MSGDRPPRAALVIVGTEMLALGARESNSEFLKRELMALGYDVGRLSIVADDEDLLGRELRSALAQASLTVVSGGLGPTGDDRTRQALARALPVRLRPDSRAWRRLLEWYRARRRRPGPGAARQIRVPAGAQCLDNPLGSAPGIWWSRGGRRLVALPGVPAELEAMWREVVRPRLGRDGESIPMASFSVGGLTESEVDARLAGLYRRPHVDLTLLAKTGHIEVYVRGRGPRRAARAALESAAAEVRRRLGERLFAEEGETLEEVVGEMLRERRQTLAVAESCTGGLLGARLTSVPGASDYFLGGIIAYADAAKRRLLGVPAAILQSAGAVSAPAARALARGACARLRSDWGLSVTGVAGPGGGRARKPVGTVFLGLARRGRPARSRRLLLPGDRDSVRRRAAAAALLWLRDSLRGGERKR